MFIAGCLMNQNNIKKLIDIAQNFYDSSFADSATLLEFQKFPHMFVLGCVMDSQINYMLVVKEIKKEDLILPTINKTLN